jgi:hypothetical protein
MQIPVIRDFLPAEGFGERHPDAPAELEQFGQLAGIWVGEQEMRMFQKGWVIVGSALWVWRYALGGFAVRDLWYQAAGELPAYLGELGRDYLLSSTRIFSPVSSRWEIAWTANGLGRAPGQDFGTFHATWEEGRIVMTSPGGGTPQRIIFSDFTPDSFLWTSEFSQDEGESWIEVMRVRATRYRYRRISTGGSRTARRLFRGTRDRPRPLGYRSITPDAAFGASGPPPGPG